MSHSPRYTDLCFGDTVLISDPAWAGYDGHTNRTAVVIGVNGDGTISVVRTSTSAPRRGRPAAAGTRRLAADGIGTGNSLAKTCDLMATTAGIVDIYPAAILRYRGDYGRGTLSTADTDWLDDRLDAMGWG